MGYARSAKVGFRVVSENMDAIDRANDKMDRLIRSSREANNQLSHFGDRMSVQGLTKFEDKYDSLISKSKKLSDNLTSDVDNINNRLKGLADSSREYAGQIGKAFSDTSKEARNSFKRLPKEANFKVKTNLKQTSSDIDHANTRVQRFGTKGKSSFDNLSRSGRKTTKSFRNLYDAGNDFVNISSQIAMGAGMVGAAFLKSANEATNLQNKYITIKNLLKTGGESTSQSKRETSAMQKENNRFALQYGVSPTAMARGGEELVRRGYNGSQELASHKYFLQAARASGDPYNAVVNYGAPTLEQFGYKTKAGNSRRKMAAYTKKVLNEMAYGSDLTATNFEGMGNSLRYVGATAHSSNQGLARTVAGVGVLSNNGQDGSIAGTGLRKVMNSFAAPNMTAKSQQGQVMSALGLKPSDFQKANGQVKSLADNMDVLKKATAGMSSAQKFNVFHMFFGTTGQESGLILANNTKQLRSLTGQVSRAQKYGKNGYIATLAKKNMASWKNQINVFKQYVNIMGMGFTKTILPLFTKALGVANKFLKVLIGLPSPIKKAAGYAAAFAGVWGGIKVGKGLLGLSSSLLFGKGRKASTASRVLSTVEDVAGASPLVGSRIRREEKVSATRIGSTHFAPSRLGNAATALSSDKLLKGMSYATIGLQIGGHAVSAFKHGIDSKQGGSQMWQAGGNAVGAGLGLALSGGNPLVAMIGSSVGGSVAKYIAGSKYIKNLAKGGNIDGTKRKESVPGESGAGLQGSEAQAANGLGYQQAMNTRSDKDRAGNVGNSGRGSAYKATSVSNALGSWTYASLNKANRSYVKQAVSLERQGNIAWAQSAGKTSTKVSAIYGKLYKLADKQADKQLASSEKGYSSLRKQGLLSSSAAEKATSSEKSSIDSRLNYLKSHLRKISTDDNLSGAKRAKLIQKVNARILSLTDVGANKQKLIMINLMSSTTHLTVHGYAKILTISKKNEQQTISSAKKTYSAEKKSANKRYATNVKLAKTLPHLTASQRQGVIKQAEKQRKQSISKAYSQYKDSVKYAERQRKEVVNQAKKEAGEAANAFSVAAKNVGKSIPALITQNLKIGLSTSNPKFKSSDFTKNMAANNRHGGALPASSSNNKTFKAYKVNKLPKSPFASHALGTSGAEMHSHAALVGEGGTELAYTVNGRKARLLGANGPEITHVKHGERILNHRDTKKVLNGSYGRVLPGYATGNTKLGGKRAKSDIDGLSKKSGQVWSKVSKTTSKHTKDIKKQTVSDYDALQKGSYKQLSQFDKGNALKWRNINSDTKHYTTKSKNQAISTYDSMQKGVQKQLNQMRSGVISTGKATATGFGHALGKMDNYAHSAMSNTVHQLNGGIKGIDKVLGQFGGNSSVINAIHYANGSNGKLAHDQLAILNDAKSGPRQEAIVHRNGLLSLPTGKDSVHYLKRGESVLNGHQVKKLTDQGIIPHYAKGSGVSHTELNRIISKNNAHPNRAFANEFSSNISKSNTVLGNAIKWLSKRSTTKYGNPWSAEVWRQMDNARGDGGGAYGSGTWLHSPGSGFNDTSGLGYRGAVSGGLSIHDGNDFSGAHIIHAVHPGKVIRSGGAPRGWGGPIGIGQNMVTKSADGYYVIYQEFNGKNNSGAHTFVGVGDNVKAGQRIAALGPAGTHVHIGVSKRNPFSNNPDSTSGWFDVTKMKSTKAKKSSKESHKASSALSKLVAKEIAPQLKWIENNLQVSGGNFGGQMGGSSITKAMIRKAESVMKVPSSIRGKIMSDILRMAFSESGNRNTMQHIHDSNSAAGNPAGGPLQYVKSTFMNYAVPGHKNWASPYDQVLAYLNNSQYKSAVGMTTIWGHRKFDWLGSGPHGSRRFANGGWSSVPAIFGEKKGEPEVAINPKRKSADGLIASAISARSKISNSVFSNESQKKMHRALLENLRKYNPLKNMPDKHQPTSGKGNNVTVNLDMNITVNANDKNAGTKVANDISRQVEEKVQAMFGKMMATREGGTA
ncbi:Phage-related minor tail protein [Lentilactobacillus parabuchneri]|uniref:phage tail tape measure protein n=1 Tax=Lentilactobacillus parabuchneri TaxID=152331 RepID=UPI000A231C2D|nr:phage tail tape measure protein [Lentilactobacillus parabuchneri]ORN25109.1 Phage-related minor tail protein [Lentilactobacillus parabuchneri]